MKNSRTLALAAAAAVLSACARTQSGIDASPLPPSGVGTPHGASPISHVVIVIQENRSFDNLFAKFGRGSDGASSGKEQNGKTVALWKAPLAERDIDHGHGNFVIEYDKGKMDGFDRDPYVTSQVPSGTFPYQFVDPAQIAPYWTLAEGYTLADHMFQTQTSGSFTAHQDLIAGGTAINKTQSLVDYPTAAPWGCDAPKGTVTSLLDASGGYLANRGPFPCVGYATMRDLLDAKGLSWKYYTPPVFVGSAHGFGALWNAFDAIAKVRHDTAEWSNNISVPQTNVLSDVANGKLPAVSWVVPSAADSDHPGPGSTDAGPSWVAQIVNTIGKSRYWNSTAIVIVWDDWGGFYDHVAPKQVDYNGLGFRVPCLIVSPYARHGYVDHTDYEFGSILRFVEDTYGLGSLHASDARATSIGNAFDFTAAPRAFVPIAAKYPRAHFENEKPSDVPVDTE